MVTSEKVLEVVTNKLMALTDFINSVVGENGNTIGLLSTTLQANKSKSINVGGRLTLQSGIPIMDSSARINTNTIYWTPYHGQFVPLFDGTNMVWTDIGGELSYGMTESVISPAAASNGGYDFFMWDNSGVKVFSKGYNINPISGRSGANANLTKYQGIFVNQFDITNGPKAGYGTYLGSCIYNSGNLSYRNSQVASVLATNGSDAPINLIYNHYNKVRKCLKVIDDTGTNTYTANVVTAYTIGGFNFPPVITCVNVLLDGSLEDELLNKTYNCVLFPAVGSSHFRLFGLQGPNVTITRPYENIGISANAAGANVARFTIISQSDVKDIISSGVGIQLFDTPFNIRLSYFMCGDGVNTVTYNSFPATTPGMGNLLTVYWY